MNNFPAGTRVWYYDANNRAVYGVVQAVSRTADGAVILTIRTTAGATIALPASAVSKVQ